MLIKTDPSRERKVGAHAHEHPAPILVGDIEVVLHEEPSVPRQKDNAFRDSSFPNMRARHRRLRKRSPPRPAAASSSCRSRSDERRTHLPTRRSSGPPDRRHHHPFALITALCFFHVRFISYSCAVALS